MRWNLEFSYLTDLSTRWFGRELTFQTANLALTFPSFIYSELETPWLGFASGRSPQWASQGVSYLAPPALSIFHWPPWACWSCLTSSNLFTFFHMLPWWYAANHTPFCSEVSLKFSSLGETIPNPRVFPAMYALVQPWLSFHSPGLGLQRCSLCACLIT